MENGKIKVWLPTIRAGSGTDIFTDRLASALERHGMIAKISWFSPWYEPAPILLRSQPPPDGTDVILANSWYGFAFKRAGVPLVVTVHHSGFSFVPAPYRSTAQKLYHRFIIAPAERRSLSEADAVTAVSHFVANSLNRIVNERKVTVTPNWIDTVLFSPAVTARPPVPKFRLLFVGKSSRLKGTDLLARIMENLGANFELCIAGRVKAREFANFPDNVRWLGWLDTPKLIRAYQACDALLFPTRSEGFGYVALEAMSCGKPVIASDTTALPELIEHKVSGLLCPVEDVSAFVQACQHLAANPDYALAMGHAARQRVLARFTEATTISRYLSLIHELSGH